MLAMLTGVVFLRDMVISRFTLLSLLVFNLIALVLQVVYFHLWHLLEDHNLFVLHDLLFSQAYHVEFEVAEESAAHVLDALDYLLFRQDAHIVQ